MSNRQAVIIIGSNSIRLLAADHNIFLTNPVRGRVETRLFSALDEKGRLTAGGIARAAEAVCMLHGQALKAGAQRVFLAATSATRDAANSDALAAALVAATGLDMVVLSGEEEAELAFLGALVAEGINQSMTGVIDIGGGSTEVAVGNSEGMVFSHSLQLGARRLMLLNRVDTVQDIAAASVLAEQALHGFRVPQADRWLLVGGTGTTLAHMMLGQPPEEALPEGFSFTKKEAEAQLQRLAALPPQERAGIPGLPPERVDIMPTGLVILTMLMQHLGIPRITVTERNNTDGFLYQRVQQA